MTTSPEMAPVPVTAPSARRRALLAFLVLLFVLWIGYLALLAATTRHPVVLSRPQLLVSNLLVVATLGGAEHPESTVTVKEVVWAGDPALKAKASGKLVVKNMAEVGREQGWEGPGDYILALTEHRDGTFTVTRVPPSPGYRGDYARIYPATASARAQLAEIVRQFHPQ